jgi:hypothetical protein
MPSRASIAIGTVLVLFLVSGCTGSSGMGAPTVNFSTPPSATQVSSDNPEIPGAPPVEAPLPATIPTNPAQGPSYGQR